MTERAAISVLHVDDEPELAEVVATFLEREDDRLTVETATSARDGLARLDETQVDCIVSDYDMPGTNGIEFLKTVREEYPDLPFILFTGKGSETIASDAISAGVTDYLQKGTGTDQYQLLANRITNAVERSRTERQLREERERYRSLFENNPLVIWEEDFSELLAHLEDLAEDVDDLEAYLDANPEEARNLLGMIEVIDVNETALDYYNAATKDELLANLEAVFTDEAFEAFLSACVAFVEGERRFRTENTARTLDGEVKQELLELYVPERYAGDFSRVYVTGMEITERRERIERLERENERLEEFASVVSHDLRNPLDVAERRLRLAREEFDSEHLEAVSGALDRSKSIIDDLLVLAREDETTIETTRVELSAVLEAAWRHVETGGATLVDETDSTLTADPDRLQRLLENLFRNAVEHGSTGPRSQAPEDAAEQGDADVTVTVGEVADGFYVADDGVGISPERRDRVFESGYSTHEDGTGLGLAIVERIVEAHGWTVRVRDSAEGGARFEVTGIETSGSASRA